MNIAYFLTPKQEVESLYDDNTFRKGLEFMRQKSYSVVPVTTRENIYVGSVSISDFLWYMYDNEIDEQGNVSTKNVNGVLIKDIMRPESPSAVSITAELDELLEAIMQKNFVPVVDARGAFIGIVTRHSMLEYLKTQNAQ